MEKLKLITELMSVSVYLLNACNMVRDWSKDRATEKTFQLKPKVPDRNWILAYDSLFKGKAIIQQLGKSDIYVTAKKESKNYITLKTLKANTIK